MLTPSPAIARRWTTLAEAMTELVELQESDASHEAEHREGVRHLLEGLGSVPMDGQLSRDPLPRGSPDPRHNEGTDGLSNVMDPLDEIGVQSGQQAQQVRGPRRHGLIATYSQSVVAVSGWMMPARRSISGEGEPEANKVELAGSERMERVGDRGAVWQTSVTAD